MITGRPRRSGGYATVWLFVVFLVIYGLTAGVSLKRQSLAPHFVHLAESLLRGRLDLLHVPSPPYDLTLFEGRWYVSFPPMPAVLMLPLVAVWGLSVSDIAVSVVLGALSVAFLWLALERLEIGGQGFRIWLCVLLGLGTPLWYCAALGSVWYTAHVVAVACLCLYAVEVLGKNRPARAGLWLGLGFLARAPVLLAFPLSVSVVPGLQKLRSHRQVARFLLLFALGVVPALFGQAAYNWARFGNPMEFGYRWMNSPGLLLERQAVWGQFSFHFLPENLYTLLIRPPLVSLDPFRVAPDPWGMGLLFTCPALLLGLQCSRLDRRRALAKGRRQPSAHKQTRLPARAIFPRLGVTLTHLPRCLGHRGALRVGLLLSTAFVLIPSLLYFNTGSYQFGYRFALDWLPLGVLLVALQTGGRLRWWGKVLIVFGVLMQLWGVLWMYPNFNGQPWHCQYVQLARDLFHLAIDSY